MVYRFDIFYLDFFISELCLVLIGIYGGNWFYGYKEWLGFGVGFIVEVGVIFVFIEYCFSGVVKWLV